MVRTDKRAAKLCYRVAQLCPPPNTAPRRISAHLTVARTVLRGRAGALPRYVKKVPYERQRAGLGDAGSLQTNVTVNASPPTPLSSTSRMAFSMFANNHHIETLLTATDTAISRQNRRFARITTTPAMSPPSPAVWASYHRRRIRNVPNAPILSLLFLPAILPRSRPLLPGSGRKTLLP